MKKNNKGFFLAETIVVLALVTTTMAFVYPNVSKLYDNYNSRIKYYDQTQDILLLKEIYNAYKIKIDAQTKGKCGDVNDFVGSVKFKTGDLLAESYGNPTKNSNDEISGGIRLYQNDVIDGDIYFTNKLDDDSSNDSIISDNSDNKLGLKNDFGLVRLYLTGYMTNLSAGDYNFNRYLKRLRKVTNDIHAYRLIGVFYSDFNGDGKEEFRFASIKINTDTFCEL